MASFRLELYVATADLKLWKRGKLGPGTGNDFAEAGEVCDAAALARLGAVRWTKVPPRRMAQISVGSAEHVWGADPPRPAERARGMNGVVETSRCGGTRNRDQ